VDSPSPANGIVQTKKKTARESGLKSIGSEMPRTEHPTGTVNSSEARVNGPRVSVRVASCVSPNINRRITAVSGPDGFSRRRSNSLKHIQDALGILGLFYEKSSLGDYLKEMAALFADPTAFVEGFTFGIAAERFCASRPDDLPPTLADLVHLHFKGEVPNDLRGNLNAEIERQRSGVTEWLAATDIVDRIESERLYIKQPSLWRHFDAIKQRTPDAYPYGLRRSPLLTEAIEHQLAERMNAWAQKSGLQISTSWQTFATALERMGDAERVRLYNEWKARGNSDVKPKKRFTERRKRRPRDTTIFDLNEELAVSGFGDFSFGDNEDVDDVDEDAPPGAEPVRGSVSAKRWSGGLPERTYVVRGFTLSTKYKAPLLPTVDRRTKFVEPKRVRIAVRPKKPIDPVLFAPGADYHSPNRALWRDNRWTPFKSERHAATKELREELIKEGKWPRGIIEVPQWGRLENLEGELRRRVKPHWPSPIAESLKSVSDWKISRFRLRSVTRPI
jgi:hypothetical protein